MFDWWFLIQNTDGYPMKVYITAPSAYEAQERAKLIYGSSLLTEVANLV